MSSDGQPRRVCCYEVLGVTRVASEAQIKKAYRRGALKNHPDKLSGKSETEQAEAKERFTEIGQAYAILSDPEKRRLYDIGESRGRSLPARLPSTSHLHHFA